MRGEAIEGSLEDTPEELVESAGVSPGVVSSGESTDTESLERGLTEPKLSPVEPWSP